MSRRPVLGNTSSIADAQAPRPHTSAMPLTASRQNCMRIWPIIGLDTLSCTVASSTYIVFNIPPSSINNFYGRKTPLAHSTQSVVRRGKMGQQDRTHSRVSGPDQDSIEQDFQRLQQAWLSNRHGGQMPPFVGVVWSWQEAKST